jgi:hypothetical protein
MVINLSVITRVGTKSVSTFVLPDREEEEVKRDDKRDVSRYCKDRPAKDKVGFLPSSLENHDFPISPLLLLEYLCLSSCF